MFIVVFSLVLCFLLSFFVFLTAWVLSHRFFLDREKSSPFECGFDPKDSARVPFSMRFFLLAVIFLIFDVEIALLIPFPYFFFSSISFLGFSCCIFFIVILLLGVFHEWREGSLDWIGWNKLV